MLVIFDLDDTLIDSSGCFMSVKLKSVLETMMNNGLKIDSKKKALQRLWEINKEANNGQEAIRSFLRELNSENFLEIGLSEYLAEYKGDFSIELLDGAVKVLTELKKNHTLILVSFGNEKLQYKKIEKANLSLDFFQEVIITKDYNKKAYYRNIMEKFNFLPQKILVVGDKFKTDLLPAKELRMKTVQMQWGRSKQFPAEKGEVDYFIKNLKEILNIVELPENK